MKCNFKPISKEKERERECHTYASGGMNIYTHISMLVI